MERSSARKTALSGRACDRCRSIKIKARDCNVGTTDSHAACSACERRGHACTFNTPVKKRGPRKRSLTPGLSTETQDAGLEAAGRASELEVFNAISPTSIRSPDETGTLVSSPQQHATSAALSTVESISHHLIRTLSTTVRSTAQELMAECIDLYLRHLFPITPVIHEASVRETWSRIFRYSQPLTPGHPSPNSDGFSFRSNLQHQRSLTMLTAVCAAASALIPSSLFPAGQSVAGLFLKASRDMLHLFEDEDIEQPQAATIIVRYFHTICTHAKGNQRVSWHIMGECIRLALEMNLYDEAALAGLDPVEAQLRRAIYWQLHTGDRSAAILNERPFTLHHLTLGAPLSLLHMGPEDTHLLDGSRSHNSLPFVQCLNVGFNLSTRLFTTAAAVLFDLRLLQDFSGKASGSGDLVRGQSASIVDSVLNFRGALDDIPSWLDRPWLAELSPDEETAMYQRDALWVQHVNLNLTFHCLRLILLQKASETGHAALLGYSKDPRLLAMQKTDIARDVLVCIGGAPFKALQINGESCIEKIRQVGATLLQLSQSGEEHVAHRAKTDFQQLLDVLTRLDSKVSAAMCRDVEMA